MTGSTSGMNQPFRMTANGRHSVFGVLAAALAALAVLLSACSSPAPKPAAATKPAARVVDTQHGIASIYTDHRTASGERFSAHAFTAAHRHWPLGCLVRCTNPHNGRWVVVRINDRGPYIRGRIIDLTPKAADAIGLTRAQGVCRVRIDRLQ